MISETINAEIKDKSNAYYWMMEHYTAKVCSTDTLQQDLPVLVRILVDRMSLILRESICKCYSYIDTIFMLQQPI